MVNPYEQYKVGSANADSEKYYGALEQFKSYCSAPRNQIIQISEYTVVYLGVF